MRCSDVLSVVELLRHCDREAAMLETLLAEQPPTDWTMSRFAGEHDSAEERPYQEPA